MATPERARLACARLLLAWLNERFSTAFALSTGEGEGLVASDGERRLGLYVAPLWDEDEGWEERLRAAEQRVAADGSHGAYLLWVPPRAEVPVDEPAASFFVQRVQEAAATLAPGARTEVALPVTVKMGKLREEGGYASVVGGLSRWWTRITENVQGTFHVESSAVHRLTADGVARERLWETIGRLALGVEVGQAIEFEIEEAWTLQRLADSDERGFVIVGAPPAVDPADGVLVRRMARRRLQAANEALGALEADLRAVGLIGSYEYAELEGAGAVVKSLDPGLFARFEVVCVLADGEVRPTFLPRALPWA